MRRWLSASIALVVACGGREVASEVDSGAAGADAGRPAIGAPVAPAPPSFTCPEGWAETSDTFGIGCDPTPRAPDLGRCPASGFPEDLPAGAAVLYVRAGATSGSGARERPFGTIREAVSRARAGTIVAVARGTYPEVVDLFAGVSLVGACAAETRITPAATTEGAVKLLERGTALRDVTIAPSAGAGLRIMSDPTIERVVIEGASAYAVAVFRGATVTGTDLVVRGTTDPTGSGFARALDVESGSSVTLDRVLFEDNGGGAIHADAAGTLVRVTNLTVRRNGREVDGARQVSVQDGARIELRASLLEDIWGAGLVALGVDATIDLEDVVLRGFQSDVTPGSSGGAVLNEGARLEARRVRIESPEGFGIVALGGSSVTLSDVVLRATMRGDDETGVALGVGQGSSLNAQRLWLEGTGGAALMAADPGTEVHLADVHVSRTGETPAADIFGFAFGKGSRGVIERVDISGTTSAALLVTETGTRLEATDLRVVETSARADGTFGRALEVQLGASASVTRALFASNREVTVLAIRGSSLSLEDVRIEDSRPRGCAETTCADAPGGTGIGAYGSEVVARTFVVDGASLCGVQIAESGTMRLEDGEVRGAAVGACVQVEPFDLAQITSSVVYAANGVNVDMSTHAVPEPTEPLPSL